MANRTESCYQKVPNKVRFYENKTTGKVTSKSQPFTKGIPVRHNMKVPHPDGTTEVITRRAYKKRRADEKSTRRATHAKKG